MHFLALATDYDGTIAHDGMLEPETDRRARAAEAARAAI